MPTTDILINSRDREANRPYIELVYDEDFLGSHVLRINPTAGPGGPKDGANVRDNRGKARQFTTINGRTVIIKENSVYSNKGMSRTRNLHRERMLLC